MNDTNSRGNTHGPLDVYENAEGDPDNEFDDQDWAGWQREKVPSIPVEELIEEALANVRKERQGENPYGT